MTRTYDANAFAVVDDSTGLPSMVSDPSISSRLPSPSKLDSLAVLNDRQIARDNLQVIEATEIHESVVALYSVTSSVIDAVHTGELRETASVPMMIVPVTTLPPSHWSGEAPLHTYCVDVISLPAAHCGPGGIESTLTSVETL